MKNELKTIYVFASWPSLAVPTLVGLLNIGSTRGKESQWFEFDLDWLKSGHAIDLNPELKAIKGKIYPSFTTFGPLSDASPDRWGRRLMLRREARLARSEGRPVKTLMESDFLLGVDDTGRMGALRFKLEENGPFLEQSDKNSCPPITDLRTLQRASFLFDSDDESKVDEALKILLRPGASLGGARPKANVIDPSGALWIAKFPSLSDDHDVGGWEEVTAQLARAAGIGMSRTRAEKLGGHKNHTFLTERFDRTSDNGRHHYASAMSLLGKNDGESEECSYLNLLEILAKTGGQAKTQYAELWRRIVFSICVSNTDDHLRNHGFLFNFEDRNWNLSPAFDINPNPQATGLTLSIDDHNNALSLELALSVSPYFQISLAEAKETANHIRSIVKGWKTIAKRLKIKASEIEMMAEAYERNAR